MIGENFFLKSISKGMIRTAAMAGMVFGMIGGFDANVAHAAGENNEQIGYIFSKESVKYNDITVKINDTLYRYAGNGENKGRIVDGSDNIVNIKKNDKLLIARGVKEYSFYYNPDLGNKVTAIEKLYNNLNNLNDLNDLNKQTLENIALQQINDIMNTFSQKEEVLFYTDDKGQNIAHMFMSSDYIHDKVISQISKIEVVENQDESCKIVKTRDTFTMKIRKNSLLTVSELLSTRDPITQLSFLDKAVMKCDDILVEAITDFVKLTTTSDNPSPLKPLTRPLRNAIREKESCLLLKAANVVSINKGNTEENKKKAAKVFKNILTLSDACLNMTNPSNPNAWSLEDFLAPSNASTEINLKETAFKVMDALQQNWIQNEFQKKTEKDAFNKVFNECNKLCTPIVQQQETEKIENILNKTEEDLTEEEFNTLNVDGIIKYAFYKYYAKCQNDETKRPAAEADANKDMIELLIKFQGKSNVVTAILEGFSAASRSHLEIAEDPLK